MLKIILEKDLIYYLKFYEYLSIF